MIVFIVILAFWLLLGLYASLVDSYLMRLKCEKMGWNYDKKSLLSTIVFILGGVTSLFTVLILKDLYK
tara:strand:- start:454 stop:657 length:204 start_codon:yes stop_codon:yes gene_type:complete